MMIKLDEVWEPYRPPNGTEGQWFQAEFCFQCYRYRQGLCAILRASLLYLLTDPGYPRELVRSEMKVKCTAFQTPEQHKANRKSRVTKVSKNQMTLF